MDTVAEFRRHATECERMARSIADAEPKSRWRNLAERWHRCADLAEREQREAARCWSCSKPPDEEVGLRGTAGDIGSRSFRSSRSNCQDDVLARATNLLIARAAYQGPPPSNLPCPPNLPHLRYASGHLPRL
jgi:hypothetical protein